MKNRRGQIFLILTILVISFIVGISTILINVQRSEYFDPAPDSDESFEIWQNTISAVKQIYSVQIAINTQVPNPSGLYTIEIQAQLDNLETYLIDRGFSASINMNGAATYVAPVSGTASNLASMAGIVSIQISSPSGIDIIQELSLTVAYDAVYDAISVGSELTIRKIVGTDIDFLRDSSIIPPGGGSVVDNGNGSYSIVGAGQYVITTPDNVLLDVTI